MSENRTPIRASDRLQDLFKRDERLIDILASHSPQLAKLRHSPMRRIMARVTTVEQAAGICGVPAASLIRDLNHALGIDSMPDDHASVPGATTPDDVAQVKESVATQSASVPLPVFPGESVVELDVRDDLRNGREPFSKIMGAVAALRDTEVLHLRATFEPVPLFAVLEKRGLAHHAEQHGPDDWSVWFYRMDTHSAVHAQNPNPVIEVEMQSNRDTLTTPQMQQEVWLDVRGLEPPEPMVRTLEALEQLPAESVLVQINVRVPQFLLPILHERGFNFEIDESQSDQVQVRIWRASSQSPNERPIELDARPIPPRDKHPTIFRTFDNLASGQSMMLINDHDPRPLWYQLAAERPDSFEWTYKEEGPEVWRVLIDRK